MCVLVVVIEFLTNTWTVSWYQGWSVLYIALVVFVDCEFRGFSLIQWRCNIVLSMGQLSVPLIDCTRDTVWNDHALMCVVFLSIQRAQKLVGGLLYLLLYCNANIKRIIYRCQVYYFTSECGCLNIQLLS